MGGFILYPELFVVVGSNTPDLRGRFLQEKDTPGQRIEAGLPNITGEIHFQTGRIDRAPLGVFTLISSSTVALAACRPDYPSRRGLSLDASRSSPVYGRSETVQPPAYSVRYLIRAIP